VVLTVINDDGSFSEVSLKTTEGEGICDCLTAHASALAERLREIVDPVGDGSVSTDESCVSGNGSQESFSESQAQKMSDEDSKCDELESSEDSMSLYSVSLGTSRRSSLHEAFLLKATAMAIDAEMELEQSKEITSGQHILRRRTRSQSSIEVPQEVRNPRHSFPLN
jgi:hypothetical protein